jgi:hypothetical protein
MEKQIEEMTKLLLWNYDMPYEFSKGLAEFLFDEGYLKATDIAREIFEEIEEGIKAAISALQFENNPIHRKVKHETYSSLMRFIKTVEQKYTGSWEKRDCSNCKNRNEEGCSFGNMCITSNSPYATPSHWKAKESEDTE